MTPGQDCPPYPDALERGKSVFLAASVPYAREEERRPNDESPSDNQAFVASADALAIAEAVTHVARQVIGAGWHLVTGGHPLITPMLMRVVRSLGPDYARSVWTFQSRWFEADFNRGNTPLAALQLLDEGLDQILWVSSAPAHQPTRDGSLAQMRRIMIQCPSLRGAIAIGGMSGVIQEIQLFERTWQTVNRKRMERWPVFPIGSTGAAAQQLLGRASAGLGSPHEIRHPRMLRDEGSYPLVASEILACLETL